jgi:HEAT repeat protein
VDCLTRGLEDKNENVRIWCAQELWRIGPNARSAVPALLQALQNSNAPPRTILGALGNIGPGAYTTEVLQALEKGLRSNDRHTRSAAIEALSGMTANAAGAVPALVEAMNSGNNELADPALRTLARIGHLPKDLQPKLEQLMDSENEFRRAGAAVALLRIEPENTRALSVVRQCLQTNNPKNLRSSTVYLLGGMGREAKTFERELQNLAQDNDPNVKTFARDALSAMQRDPQAP